MYAGSYVVTNEMYVSDRGIIEDNQNTVTTQAYCYKG